MSFRIVNGRGLPPTRDWHQRRKIKRDEQLRMPASRLAMLVRAPAVARA